jgi:hypothetical protein
MNKRNLFLSALVTISLLLIPFGMSHLSYEIKWSLFDYIVAGTLLFTSTGLFSMIYSLKRNQKQKIIYSLILLIFITLLWTELAVGIFESPIAGN